MECVHLRSIGERAPRQTRVISGPEMAGVSPASRFGGADVRAFTDLALGGSTGGVARLVRELAEPYIDLCGRGKQERTELSSTTAMADGGVGRR